MSGLEVAGLIFGVIPLFISAFEHYEEGIRPFKRFFNYEQEVARYRARLLIQYTTYIQTLEYLLTDFVDKDELENMVTKGYCDLWKDYHLSVKLEQQLGKAYESFCFLLTELRTDMEALASVLDIERQGQVWHAPRLCDINNPLQRLTKYGGRLRALNLRPYWPPTNQNNPCRDNRRKPSNICTTSIRS